MASSALPVPPRLVSSLPIITTGAGGCAAPQSWLHPMQTLFRYNKSFGLLEGKAVETLESITQHGVGPPSITVLILRSALGSFLSTVLTLAARKGISYGNKKRSW